jgi:hypothetical protein
MEFGIPAPIAVSAAGNVTLSDPVNGRLTIVGPDFSLLRDQTLPPGYGAIAVLPNGDHVLNMSHSTPNGLGRPLHLARGQEIIKSFGNDEIGIFDPRRMRRVLAVSNSLIFSADPGGYQIELFKHDGTFLGIIEGAPFSSPPLPQRINSPEGAPPVRLHAMRIDDEGRLWVVIHEVRDDWEDSAIEFGEPGRTRVIPQNEDMTKWYRTRIDVIDVDSLTRIATIQTQRLISALAGEEMAVETRLTTGGIPQLGIVRLEAKFPN